MVENEGYKIDEDISSKVVQYTLGYGRVNVDKPSPEIIEMLLSASRNQEPTKQPGPEQWES